jgi:hypothetical protein
MARQDYIVGSGNVSVLERLTDGVRLTRLNFSTA